MIYSLLNDISWVVNIRTPYLTPIFEFFTWLGYRDFLFMFIPFIYWCYDRKVFGKLLVIVFFSAIINSFLKDIFQDPRPDLILIHGFKLKLHSGFQAVTLKLRS